MSPLACDWDRDATFPDTTARKSRYGVAYLKAVCAQYGVGITENDPDEDFLAVDATIDYAPGGVRVQVKCTSIEFNSKGYIRLPLKRQWVDKWKANLSPVYLLLVQVEPLPISWIDYDKEHETLHRTSAYWARIDTIDVGSASLEIYDTERFTPETIRDWQDELLTEYGKPKEVK